MKIGLTSGDFANRLDDLPDCLDRFQALGVDSVELPIGALDVVAGGRVLPQRLAALKRICADRPYGFTTHGPIASNFGDPDHNQLQRDVCLACLEVSAAIGASVQVWHGATIPQIHEDQRDERLGLERETLATLASDFQASGVVLGLETVFPMGDTWAAPPALLAEQISAVDHPAIRATVDFSHSAITCTALGLDLIDQLRQLVPLTGHLHIHDSFGKPQSFRPFTHGEAINFGLGDLHLPPGWGGLPWGDLGALPWPDGIIANIELSHRFESALADSIAFTRNQFSADTA